jgi:hypothetical protein
MENLETLDARFPTRNTSLASALVTLFVFLKKVQPTSVIRDAETGKQIFTYYFEPEGSEEFCGEHHVADVIGLHWSNRQSFELAHPNHPLVPIRKSLDSRDFLNRVRHREITLPHSSARTRFKTDDIVMASCLRASGHPVLRYTEKTREFEFGSVGQKFRDDYDAYGFRNPDPISLMRRVLVVRPILIDFITNKTPRVIHHRSGDPSTNEFADCFIPEGMKQEDANTLLERFHSL